MLVSGSDAEFGLEQVGVAGTAADEEDEIARFDRGAAVLVGDGDPTFGDAELLKKVNWTPTTVFANWAA